MDLSPVSNAVLPIPTVSAVSNAVSANPTVSNYLSGAQGISHLESHHQVQPQDRETYLNQKIQEIFQTLDSQTDHIKMIDDHAIQLSSVLNSYPFVSEGYHLVVKRIKKLRLDTQKERFVSATIIETIIELKTFLKKITIFILLSQEPNYYNNNIYNISDICKLFIYTGQGFNGTYLRHFMSLTYEQIKQLAKNKDINVSILQKQYPYNDTIVIMKQQFIKKFKEIDNNNLESVRPGFLQELKSTCEQKKIFLHSDTVKMINIGVSKLEFHQAQDLLRRILSFLQHIDDENPYLDTSICSAIFGINNQKITIIKLIAITKIDLQTLVDMAKKRNLISFLEKTSDRTSGDTEQNIIGYSQGLGMPVMTTQITGRITNYILAKQDPEIAAVIKSHLQEVGPTHLLSASHQSIIEYISNLQFNPKTRRLRSPYAIQNISELKKLLTNIAIFKSITDQKFYYANGANHSLDICKCFIYSNKTFQTHAVRDFIALSPENVEKIAVNSYKIMAIITGLYPLDKVINHSKQEHEQVDKEYFRGINKDKIEKLIPDFIYQLKETCKYKNMILHKSTILTISYCVSLLDGMELKRVLTNILLFLQSIDDENSYLDTSMISKLCGFHKDIDVLSSKFFYILRFNEEAIKKIAKNPNLINLIKENPRGIFSYTQQELEDKNIIESSPEASNTSVTTMSVATTSIPIPVAKLATEEKTPQDLTRACEQIEQIIKRDCEPERFDILDNAYMNIYVECAKKYIAMEETLVKIFGILVTERITNDDALAIAKKLTEVVKELPVKWGFNSTKFLASVFNNNFSDILNLLALKYRNVAEIIESIQTKYQIAIADNNQLSDSPLNDSKKRHLDDDDSFTSNKKPKQI